MGGKLTIQEQENLDRLENLYSPQTIKLSNDYLLAKMRLRQIESWRQKQLEELSKKAEEEAKERTNVKDKSA